MTLARACPVMHIQGFTQQQVSYATEDADVDALFARFATEHAPSVNLAR